MKIECPNCQQECTSDVDSIPPEGIQVECQHCRFSFVMRAHASEEVVPAIESSTVKQSPKPADLHAAVLATRKKAPRWMVHAYPHPFSLPTSAPDQHNMPAMDPDRVSDGRKREIPILVDDSLAEEFSFAQDEFIGPSAPKKIWKPDEKFLRIQKLKRLAAAAVGIAVLAVVVLLVYRAGPSKILQGALDLGKSVTAALPFGKADEGRLRIYNLQSDFVVRGKGEPPAFIIQGKVTNDHSKACASVQVKGILFDEQGRRAAEESVYCGNTMTRNELQFDPKNKIKSVLQNPVGASLSNLNLEPGKSIDFLLVFFNPPERLSEFSVEIAGYTLRKTDAK